MWTLRLSEVSKDAPDDDGDNEDFRPTQPSCLLLETGHIYPNLQWHWKPSMLVRQVPPFLQTLLAHEVMLVPGPPVVVSKSEIFCVCVPVSSVAVFESVLVSAKNIRIHEMFMT